MLTVQAHLCVQSLGNFFRGPVRQRYSSANFLDFSPRVLSIGDRFADKASKASRVDFRQENFFLDGNCGNDPSSSQAPLAPCHIFRSPSSIGPPGFWHFLDEMSHFAAANAGSLYVDSTSWTIIQFDIAGFCGPKAVIVGGVRTALHCEAFTDGWN